MRQAELSVSICGQAIREEREEELLDVDREIIAMLGKNKSRNVYNSILPNEASLARQS